MVLYSIEEDDQIPPPRKQGFDDYQRRSSVPFVQASVDYMCFLFLPPLPKSI